MRLSARRQSLVALALFPLAFLAGCFSLDFSGVNTWSMPLTERREGGWVMLHLTGSPREIGLSHGRRLAAEIDDYVQVMRLTANHVEEGEDPPFDWNWCRQTAQRIIEPRVPEEYRQEMQGIADGAREQGVNIDYTDIVVINAQFDLAYYGEAWRREHRPQAKPAPVPERCSAFIATGSATADGQIVAAHNTWSGYLDGQRTNIILDITPAKGHRFVMDTQPGLIHSGTDWFISDAGIILTETTISDFTGFNEQGMPEFVRARQAIQYSQSLDDVYAWLVKQNNGAYANAWLMGDVKTREIAKLELGLKNVIFHRSSEGAYYGANYPENEKFAEEDCPDFKRDPADGTEVRRLRWKAVIAANKGKIDAEIAKGFMADVTDPRDGKTGASTCTLCGRHDLHPDSEGKTYASGAVNAKVTTSEMARRLSFWARMGFPDGSSFDAKIYLAGPGKDESWKRPLLRDIPPQPWIRYQSQ